MRLRDRLGSDDAWWQPYLGVAGLALVAGLLIFLFLLANAAEILKTLRAGGG